MSPRRWLVAAALIGAPALGCSGSDHPVTAPAPPPPRSTPEGAVKLFQWAYEIRDTAVYAILFTEDYQFQFDPADTAGDSYRTSPWSLEQELASAGHLFAEGNATEPPASSIALAVNGLSTSDTGDTLDQATHRRVSAAVALDIRAGGASMQVRGNVDFYVVRADAANVPSWLRARVQPTDWLIYLWVDRTLPHFGAERVASPLPNRSMTWGMIKSLYL